MIRNRNENEAPILSYMRVHYFYCCVLELLSRAGGNFSSAGPKLENMRHMRHWTQEGLRSYNASDT